MSAESSLHPCSTVSSHNGSDNGLCSDLFMSERHLVSGNSALNGCGYVIRSFIYLFSDSNLNSINFKAHAHSYTLIRPAQHIKPLHGAMWQTCPCLAPLSCPSRSHRAVTLVSSSCTLLESQHLSRDGLTLLSDTL